MNHIIVQWNLSSCMCRTELIEQLSKACVTKVPKSWQRCFLLRYSPHTQIILPMEKYRNNIILLVSYDQIDSIPSECFINRRPTPAKLTPSSGGPLYQNEVKRLAFDFHSHANKTHFHGCWYCCFFWVCERERVFFWDCTCRYFVKYNSAWVRSFLFNSPSRIFTANI